MTEETRKEGGQGDASVKSREEKAEKITCRACEESGLKVSSWEDFSAWQDFVDGKITEDELVEKAREELDRFSSKFGKYLVIKKEEPPREDPDKKKRVKRANKIYKDVCDKGGIELCFFSNFSTWKDFVEGKMDEDEFHEKAKIELEKLVV